MKRYIRSATDRSNKTTQTKSKKFSQSDIARKSNDVRRGETMAQITRNILNDPDMELGQADSDGNQTLIYKGQNVGWINKRRGIGDINNKVYTQIKHAAKARLEADEDAEDIEDVDVEDEDESDEDEE